MKLTTKNKIALHLKPWKTLATTHKLQFISMPNWIFTTLKGCKPSTAERRLRELKQEFLIDKQFRQPSKYFFGYKPTRKNKWIFETSFLHWIHNNYYKEQPNLQEPEL